MTGGSGRAYSLHAIQVVRVYRNAAYKSAAGNSAFINAPRFAKCVSPLFLNYWRISVVNCNCQLEPTAELNILALFTRKTYLGKFKIIIRIFHILDTSISNVFGYKIYCNFDTIFGHTVRYWYKNSNT